MALQMQTFSDFTPSMFEAFKQKLQHDMGIEIGDAPEGTVTHGSFTFQYSYNADCQILKVQCLKKPIFIPASVIINGLVEEVQELKSQATIRESMGIPS